MPWWVAAGTAVAGYLSAEQQNKQNANAAAGAGGVNLQTSNQPWGPDAQYRMWMMDAGADVLGMPRNQATGKYANPYAPQGGSTTGSSWPGVTPQTVPVGNSNLPPKHTGSQGGAGVAGSGTNPGTDPASGAGVLYSAKMPSGLNAKQQKQWGAEQERKASSGKKGAKGAKGVVGPAPAAGTNVTTQQVMDAMYKDVAAPNRTEDTAVNYSNKLLSGGDTNQYRIEAADMLRGSQNNENVDRLIAELFAGQTPGTVKQAGGRGGGGNVSYGPSGGRAAALAEHQALVNGTDSPSGASYGKVGVRNDIRKVLDGQGIPQEYRDMLERQYTEASQKNARDMNALFVGSNMQGSSSWQDAFAQGQSDASQGYSDALVGANFGLYNNALGLGTQYDISAEDRAAQAEASRQASASAAAGQGAAIDAQLQMARMGALGDAIGMQMQGRQFGAQGMTGLSGLYSGDTQQALGMTGELSNLNTAAWGSLGNIGVGRDQVNASIKNANTAANAQRGIANQQIGWEKERFYDPLARLGSYADLVNANSAAYGSQLTAGTDKRNAVSPGYVSPYGQAIAGGMAGYSLASGR